MRKITKWFLIAILVSGITLPILIWIENSTIKSATKEFLFNDSQKIPFHEVRF